MRLDDTIKLLGECSSGSKMAISAIDDIFQYVNEPALMKELQKYKAEHEKMSMEAETLLESYHHDEKEPGSIAKGMSWAKINLKMAMNPGDKTVADLMIDGCNMGVKSLSKVLNECCAADIGARALTNRIIETEEKMRTRLQDFL